MALAPSMMRLLLVAILVVPSLLHRFDNPGLAGVGLLATSAAAPLIDAGCFARERLIEASA